MGIEEAQGEVKENSSGSVLSLVGGLTIAFSGILSGLVGWGAYRFAIAMFLVVFSAAPQLAFGILVSICAIAQKRVAILTSSVISLLWFLFFAITHVDWTSYLLACLVGMIGGIFGIIGGLLLEKKDPLINEGKFTELYFNQIFQLFPEKFRPKRIVNNSFSHGSHLKPLYKNAEG